MLPDEELSTWRMEHLSHRVERERSPLPCPKLGWAPAFRATVTGQVVTCPKNQVMMVMVPIITAKVYGAISYMLDLLTTPEGG